MFIIIVVIYIAYFGSICSSLGIKYGLIQICFWGGGVKTIL
jgi:hypothetical protein